jgi:high-affinity iron transporter
MIKFFFSVIFLIFQNTVYSQSTIDNSDKSPRFAIHLLDYLAHDYGGAVSNGKVISNGEYDEQKEFAAKIYELAQTLPELKNSPATFQKIVKLQSIINSLADAKDVTLAARDIQKDLITITKITLSPNDQPSFSNGKRLFQQNCITCHGEKGLGDGAAGAEMEPAPANFHEPVRMGAISAFHCYNTIRLGVPGTGMMAFPDISDKEVWDLSFYVMGMRFIESAKLPQEKDLSLFDNITLLDLSTLSDTEIKSKIKEDDETKKNSALALLRTKDSNNSSGDYLRIASDYLNEAQNAFKNNLKDDAKRLSIQSYLEGIEPIEPMIKANKPELVVKIESEMGKIRQLIANPTTTNDLLATQISVVKEVFEEVEESIKGRELTFGVAFSGAFAIILREGFEAVLIILTLLSVIKAFGNRKAALWVHAGWSSALFLGFVAWYLSGTLMKMSGASREILEAGTSTLAVFILLYFGFWLHRQTEIGRWKKFLNEKVQSALDNKNLWGLATISFISVFREAFETVLFIRALWFQTNAEGKNAIGLGLVAALTLIFVFSFLALRYSKKIPVRELFKVSSVLTSFLALILSGKAVHSLQEAGLLNATAIPWNIRIDTIGVFPTWQTIAAQVLTLLLVMALLKLNSSSSQKA